MNAKFVTPSPGEYFDPTKHRRISGTYLFKERRGFLFEQAEADGEKSPCHIDWKVESVKPRTICYKIASPRPKDQEQSPPRTQPPAPGQYDYADQFKKMFDRSISFQFSKTRGSG